MIFKKTGTIAALVSGLTLLASSAFAGPVWTFGPEEQGLLKLEY